ncbi:hypothetical protein D3C85_952470 [compost metagenome]
MESQRTQRSVTTGTAAANECFVAVDQSAFGEMADHRACIFDIDITPTQMQRLPVGTAIAAAASVVEVGHSESALRPILDARVEHRIARRRRAAVDEHHQRWFRFAGHRGIEETVGLTRTAWVAQGLRAADLFGGQWDNTAGQHFYLAGLAIDSDYRSRTDRRRGDAVNKMLIHGQMPEAAVVAGNVFTAITTKAQSTKTAFGPTGQMSAFVQR